jgi:hypothetical protein
MIVADREYQMGETSARQDAQDKVTDGLRNDVAALRYDVQEMKLVLARVEGAWKFAVILAGFFGTIVGVVAKWLHDVPK